MPSAWYPPEPVQHLRDCSAPIAPFLPYGLVPEHCDLPVEDAHWLDLELSLGFHLNHIPIYHMVRIITTTNIGISVPFSIPFQCNFFYIEWLNQTLNGTCHGKNLKRLKKHLFFSQIASFMNSKITSISFLLEQCPTLLPKQRQ